MLTAFLFWISAFLSFFKENVKVLKKIFFKQTIMILAIHLPFWHPLLHFPSIFLSNEKCSVIIRMLWFCSITMSRLFCAFSKVSIIILFIGWHKTHGAESCFGRWVYTGARKSVRGDASEMIQWNIYCVILTVLVLCDTLVNARNLLS